MQFLTFDDDEVRYGVAEPVVPHVRRVLAENPSKFTYVGTGTYLVGAGDEVVVIDPGPRREAHRASLDRALRGESVQAILVTHCHSDHSPLAAELRDSTGAPTIAAGPHGDDAWDIGDDLPELTVASDDEREGTGSTVAVEESVDRAFVPDVTCADGEVVATGAGWRMRAVRTPGHTSNHTCFTLETEDAAALFTGDHIMGWSTTVVSPPDGDMTAYVDSLRRVAGAGHQVGIPTHGPPIDPLDPFVEQLVAHRLDREAQVLAGVRDGLDSVTQLVLRLYADVRPELHQPAARSVLAHLVKLLDEGLVVTDGGVARPRLDSRFTPV
jgi:glyoxylase-like metal-dependent hydrolase (beta-lactamase superfamily II)